MFSHASRTYKISIKYMTVRFKRFMKYKKNCCKLSLVVERKPTFMTMTRENGGILKLSMWLYGYYSSSNITD